MQKNRIKKNVFSVVFDIGKSNAKILIFDKNLKIKKIIKSKYPKTKVNKNLFIKDINFLILWFKKNLYLLSKNYKIDKIVTSAHGAAFGLVDRNDKPIFGVMDYESNFDSVLKEFIKIKPSFKESLSPVSEKGLNLGKQILFLKLKKQKIFKKTKYILLLPQYISWIFSGKYSSEISYLGNHTHLWNFKKKSYSSFAKRLKIQNKFPKINRAWKTLGSYSLDQRLKDDKIKIINGIHDSDASYLLFIKSKFKKFNLISSGTQIVTMNASTSSKYLKEGKEMYGGINIFGKTVPTIRFMGGREYEFLKQKLKINKKYEKFEPSFFSKEKFLYPSYGVGGPFSKMKGNCINFIKENGNIRYMAIITYISFVLNYSMDLLKCKDSIIITGPLIHNHNILKILNSLRGKQKIYLSSNQEGTGLGASLLFDLKKKINLDFKLFNSKKIPEINSSYQHWVKKIIN
tara:strand:+ start:3547 stop:4923 length:1377 start_codon:yes stop_codon:yes gene_type:complete